MSAFLIHAVFLKCYFECAISTGASSKINILKINILKINILK